MYIYISAGARRAHQAVEVGSNGCFSMLVVILFPDVLMVWILGPKWFRAPQTRPNQRTFSVCSPVWGLIFDDSIEDLASGRLLAPSCAILSLILRILNFLTQLLARFCSSQLNLGPSWGHPGLILGFPGGS